VSSHAARTLAHAIRRGAQRHDERQGRRVYRGTITSLSPLGVDLLGVDLTLDEDDLELSADVEAYDTTTGLAVGDVLMLLEVEDGDFVAVAVVADTGS
jgi:hypothetical protein